MAGATINGTYYSFADIEVTFGGLAFVGVKAVNYKDTEGMDYVFGAARNSIGITAGNVTPSADIEFYLPAWNTLLAALVNAGANVGGFGRVAVDITVSYSAAAGLPTVTDVIQGARIKETDASQSQSDSALTRKLVLMPQGILWNGNPRVIEPQVAFAVG